MLTKIPWGNTDVREEMCVEGRKGKGESRVDSEFKEGIRENGSGSSEEDRSKKECDEERKRHWKNERNWG